MPDIDKLEKDVRSLYLKKDPQRASWADWLYTNHVFIVTDYAEKLSRRYDAPTDLCRAAAMLHDIADCVMTRFNPDHEEESLKIARRLLRLSGFNDEQIAIVVDDAIKLHSCHDGIKPKTIVGKVLSTADALGHLDTNFYPYSTANMMHEFTDQEKRSWAAKKIERDYHEKIAFDEVRRKTKKNYEKLKLEFAE
ncbi:MAG TPA: HD domain-containing protein [Candidatus Saccharimonadales bacterium]